MREALIVNPFSREDMSEAIKQGLSMSKAERIRRWEILMDGVRKDDVVTWRDSFVTALRAAAPVKNDSPNPGTRGRDQLV